MKKPLPLAAQLGLIVSGGLAALALGWLVAVHPLSRHASSLHAQAAAVQQQIDSDLAQAAAARSATATPPIEVADLYRLVKAMPSAPDVPDLLLELDQTATAAGVQLDSIVPGAPVPLPAGGYSKVPITLAVTGNFYAVSDLLYRLRNLVSVRNGALEANGRLFSVDSVALSPLTPKKVTASLTLGAYVFGSTTPAATAATGTDTTTTSTTTTTTTTTPAGPSAAGAP